MIEPTIWTGCYNSGWQGILTPEAFCHPAKASRGLAKRIYQHAFERGWLKEFDVVVDPFGGIAGFAFHALQHGLTWSGVELEQKFVDLGQQNIALWNARYSRMPRWGSAQLLQGDSRRLSEVVREAGICISSPPYAESLRGKAVIDKKRLKRMRAAGYENRCDHGFLRSKHSKTQSSGYGSHPAQLGNMREGDFDAVVDCAISSPPWAETEVCQDKAFWLNDGRKVPPQGQAGYGTETGQLAAMPTGDVADACISSPPWEESTPTRGDPNYVHKFRGDQSKYGDDTAGNIGNATGDTFWQSARAIVEQVFQVLKPGGCCIWVLKAFVRNKAIVDFPGQWQRMAESCGFETVEIVHAMLTENRGTQYALDGELHTKTIKRSSFFRRLHERKYPHLAIDFEVVLCQRKPERSPR